jgi:hypothetical protein
MVTGKRNLLAELAALALLAALPLIGRSQSFVVADKDWESLQLARHMQAARIDHFFR